MRPIHSSPSRSPFRIRKERSALTIVELLAATTLAAFLMASVLGVLNSISRQQKILLKDQTSEPWQALLVEQIEWELLQAQTIQTTEQGVLLTGYASRHFATEKPLHRLATIRYTVAEEGDRSWLIRQETHLDSTSLDNSRTTLVCSNVQSFLLTTAEGQVKENTLNENSNESEAGSPVPPRLFIVLTLKNDPTPVISRALILH